MTELEEHVIKEKLEHYGIDHLHYIAPMENAPWILVLGIFPYNEAVNLRHKDVSLWDVQVRRGSLIPGTGKTIHDYVPLYFATHTPMQYVITQGTKSQSPIMEQEKLVFFEVDALKIFQKPGVIFTDGNAASEETCFYNNIVDLNKLDWYIIHHIQNCYSREYRRKKAAEILVPYRVPSGLFTRIVLNCKEAVNNLCERVKSARERLKVLNIKEISKTNWEIDPSHYY